MRSRLLICIAFLLLVCPIVSESASTDDGSAGRSDNVADFNLTGVRQSARSACADPLARPHAGLTPNPAVRRPLGSALSPNAGIGVGESVDLTYDDAQYTIGQGRHIGHWWNGEYGGAAEVSVHFGYRSMNDTTANGAFGYTGYNVYDAISGTWPRGQDLGCDLQATDTVGWGGMPSLDVMPNGRAVMGAMSHIGDGFLGDGSVFIDNMFFYQDPDFGCFFGYGLNVTSVDSLAYRANFMSQAEGNYSRFPQVVDQWDGSNTIVHVLLHESQGTPISGDAYVNGLEYYTCTYYRRVGDNASGGSWSAGQIIDSLWFPWASLAAAPMPHEGVAVSYTNPTYFGALLNNEYDLDVYVRESLDRGLTWQPSESITYYESPIPTEDNHFIAWLETQALYTDDGDLHVIWTARPTSDDPYFDGFNWIGWDANIYHWARSTTSDIVEVAHGQYNYLEDVICGNFDTQHCGFGGSNAGYIANINLAQCDDKLYCVWNQIHERANYNDWLCFQPQPMPGVLDDCSYTGDRLAMANWDIFMSVAPLSNSSLWDMPRNVSNTFTPGCGLPGDPLAFGLCGSEYKPSVEKYGFDETGLSLTWPSETVVDLTPPTEPAYSGNSYLNMQYIDDQFPGPAFWGRTNPPASLNSIKWVRLACVEPVFAPEIRVTPWQVQWPEWVELGQEDYYTITIINEGNELLSVYEIGTDDGGEGWLSVSTYPTVGDPLQVPAVVGARSTFDIIVDASGMASARWLDGEVWIKSDAANDDSVSISIHLLAAADVEPVVWDTVQSHENMFDIYFYPEGECVALAVSNHGEIGCLGGSLWATHPYGFGGGAVNLDYAESELECGERAADAIYLQSGSPFTILADDTDGTNARLTCSYNDANQIQETGWDPIGTLGSIRGGVGTSPHNGEQYDSVYTGRFVNRDTTIAMERVFYAPRSQDPVNETINFVVCHTKFYSGDGAAHDHVKVGSVCDWNVPSEEVNVNTSGVSQDGFVYVQGSDDLGLSCQPNANRFAAEAFVASYTSEEFAVEQCVNTESYHGVAALSQILLADTTHYRNGTPLVPSQPNPIVWWQETGAVGLSADATPMDQAVWLTYVHDFSLGATDTLHVWTVLSTVRDGDLADLEEQVYTARQWYWESLRGCMMGCFGTLDVNGSGGEPTISDLSEVIDYFEFSHVPPLEPWRLDINGDCVVDLTDYSMFLGCIGDNMPEACPDVPTCCDPRMMFDCCEGRVGDANMMGGDEPTIGDVSVIIDMLFINGTEVSCLEEADINQSGGEFPSRGDITISDISTLIDYLFITGSSLGLPQCL